MEPKKISFGFMKTKKLGKPVVEDKKDYIDCVEEKSIKIVGGEEIKENPPLIIPMKPNTLITAERLKEIAEKVESALEEPEIQPKQETEVKPEHDTLDQMAVRELIQDAKVEIKVETSELTVPVPSKLVMDGQKESTLEDYEAIPVQDFGLAMLRGMGWNPNKEKSKYKEPQLRPKGLGLGADKVITERQKKNAKDNKEEELPLVKNSFVLITSGKYSGYYGKVVSLDEDNGRVMVDITVKKETASLSEFMLHPVTKSEFDKESKVINADKFIEYKKNEKLTQESSNNKQKEGSSNETNQKYNNEKRTNDSGQIGDKANERKRETKRRTSYTPERTSNDRRREYRYSSSSEERSRNRRKSEKHSDSPNNDISSHNTRRQRYRSRSRSISNSKERTQTAKRESRSSGSEDRSRNRSNTGKPSNSYNRKDTKRHKRRNKEDKERKIHKRDSSKDSLSGQSDSNRKIKKEDKRNRTNDSGSRHDKIQRKKDKKYSSNDSSSYSPDTKHKKKKKDKKKSKNSDSDVDSEEYKSKTDKRDIDKKRKGKKKKRDRDRSPNYKKYKK